MAKARVRVGTAVASLALLAACVDAGQSPKPTASRSPRPQSLPSVAASPLPSVSTPPRGDDSATSPAKPSPSPSVKASPKPSPTPTPETGTILPSIPPIVSPYTTLAKRWKYSVKVDTGLIPVDAELSTSVAEQRATGAVLLTGVAVSAQTQKLLGGSNKEQPPRRVEVSNQAENPFLALLSSSSAGAAEATIKAAYDDKVTAMGREIACVKYLIEQVAAGATTTIRMWVAKEAGLGLVKEEIKANGLPSIGLEIPSTFPVGKTTTTLLLVSQDIDPSITAQPSASACADPVASDAGASPCADPAASDHAATGTI